MPRARWQALLFDLDDTLLDYSGAVDRCWAEACATLAGPAGVDPAVLTRAIHEVARWFWSDPDRHRRERVDMLGAWTRIAAAALDRCAGPCDGLAGRLARDFARRRFAAMRLFPDALAALEHARRRGLPLGLLTNGDARMQRAKLARWDLARFFDVIVIEGEFGAGKPDAAVFRHALGVLGVGAGQAAMIGDNLVWDVEGARRVGLHAVWLDRAGRGLPAESPVCPDRIIRTLDEVPALLG